MPQISLYIDQSTLDKVTKLAISENVSISNWVKDRIKKSLSEDWSADFKNLLGSIKDDTFTEQKELNFESDSARGEIQ